MRQMGIAVLCACIAAAQEPKPALMAALEAEVAVYHKRTEIRARTPVFEFVQTVVMGGADRLRIRTKRNEIAGEAVAIGRTFFIKTDDGWRVVPVQGTPPLVSSMPDLREIIRSSMSDVRLAGTPALDGVATQRYEVKVSTDGQFPHVEGMSYVWVDSAKKLPVRVEFDGTWAGQPYRARQTIEYDATIKVDAPVVP